MAVGTILVSLNDVDRAKELLSVASILADRHDAHLIGFYVIPAVYIHPGISAHVTADVVASEETSAVIATGGSPLPDGSVIGVTVGSALGKGFNASDTDISVADTQMSILYRGPAALVDSGIVWGAASAPNQVLFRAQLEVQQLAFITNATAVTPTYNS